VQTKACYVHLRNRKQELSGRLKCWRLWTLFTCIYYPLSMDPTCDKEGRHMLC
jgi:hypothetical protein